MTESLKHTCPHCLRTLTLNGNNFYMTKSNWISVFDTGKSLYCKECEKEYYMESLATYLNEMSAIYNTCRFLDRTFSYKILEMANSERESSEVKGLNVHPLWVYYSQKIFSTGIKYSKGGTFKDSDDMRDDLKNEIKVGKELSEFEVTDEMYKRWGNGYDTEFYIFLESEYHKLTSDFKCDDYSMEMIMKDISMLNFKIRKAYENNDSSKIIKELQDTRSKLLQDGNLKPINRTGMDAEKGFILGVSIDRIENERPIPVHIDDEIETCIKTFMTGHLAYMQGMDNEFVKMYKEAKGKYGINFDEIDKFDSVEAFDNSEQVDGES